MNRRSAIYTGEVVHTRFRPKRHKMRYKVFCLLLDLDEVEVLGRSLRLFGHNHAALFSFFDNDHGSLEKGDGLKGWVVRELEKAGIAGEDMRVEMLCYPRIFGYVFNPLTVYYCYGPAGTLDAILYEVCNTFHERHTYVIPCADDGKTVQHSCEKIFYVSPFMPMDCTYHFQLDPPGDEVAVRITEADADQKMLYAAFEGRREALTDTALLKMLVKYPLMTVKVSVAIHFEALRLLMKGLSVFRHVPQARKVASSLVSARKPGE